jgi:hypothetical protein
MCVVVFMKILKSNTSKLREEFLKFVPVTSLMGEGVAQTLLDNLTKLGIDQWFPNCAPQCPRGTITTF